MDKYMLVYLISIIYFSLIVGIGIKLNNKGVREHLLIFAIFLPIFIWYANINSAIKLINEEKLSFYRRTKKFLSVIIIGITRFPMLVGITGDWLASIQYDRALKMKIWKKRKKYRWSLVNLYTSFNDVYKEEYQDSIRFVH